VTLLVCVGDLHAGSKSAVCVPGFRYGDDDYKTPYTPNLPQEWLWACWQDAIAKVKRRTKGHQVMLALLGDLVDGDRHHNTRTTFGTPTEQSDMAAELLLPLANLANKIISVDGTETHVGGEGEQDESTAGKLGAQTKGHRLVEIDGHLFDLAHHASLPKDPDNWSSSLTRQARLIVRRRLTRDLRPADMIIRGDRHRYAVGTYDYRHAHKPSRAVMFINPAWQLRTPFMQRVEPAELFEVGLTIVDCKSLEIEPILYEAEDDPIETYSLGRHPDY
jgi:hypothetical protein